MKSIVLIVSSFALVAATPALAGKKEDNDRSSAKKAQDRNAAEIPTCTRSLGSLAVTEPETRWWTELGLSNPEAIIKFFVMKSGCFKLVDRGGGLAARAVERALGDSGELQRGSNVGKRQVKAADYVVVPDIVSSNSNSGGSGIAGALGGFLGGRTIGGLLGGMRVSKKEANVTLSLVNVRTTEVEALSEGYYRKSDVSWAAGGGAWWGGGLAAAGGGTYQNSEIGQVIVLAYLNAYKKMVGQLGGLPANASAAAPRAE
jgi:curli biogenesis system outer membrane secretion channel CsgG